MKHKLKKFTRSFSIFKVDFSIKHLKNNEPVITEVDYLIPIKITRNNHLVIIDKYNKKRYIPESFYNSINSPIWFETINKTYGYIFRENLNNQNITEIIATHSILTQDKN